MGDIGWRVRDRYLLLALAGAALWSVGLIVAGFTVSVYEGTVSPSGESTSATLVEENGSGVLVVLAVPLVITLLVGFAVLVLRRSWASWVALGLTGLLAMLNLLALLTIGIFILPVTATLVVVCCLALVAAPRADGRAM